MPMRRRSPRSTVGTAGEVAAVDVRARTDRLDRPVSGLHVRIGPTILTRHDALIDVLRWKGSLARLDLRPNDRILVMMSGLSAWPGLQFAAGLHGLIVVPVNLKLEPSEIGFLIEKTRPALSS